MPSCLASIYAWFHVAFVIRHAKKEGDHDLSHVPYFMWLPQFFNMKPEKMINVNTKSIAYISSIWTLIDDVYQHWGPSYPWVMMHFTQIFSLLTSVSGSVLVLNVGLKWQCAI